MFKNVDGQTGTGVTSILLAFSSGELKKMQLKQHQYELDHNLALSNENLSTRLTTRYDFN